MRINHRSYLPTESVTSFSPGPLNESYSISHRIIQIIGYQICRQKICSLGYSSRHRALIRFIVQCFSDTNFSWTKNAIIEHIARLREIKKKFGTNSTTRHWKSKYTHREKNKSNFENARTFMTAATVPAGLEASGIWNIAWCLWGSKCSFVGSNFSTPNFLNTCRKKKLLRKRLMLMLMLF